MYYRVLGPWCKFHCGLQTTRGHQSSTGRPLKPLALTVLGHIISRGVLGAGLGRWRQDLFKTARTSCSSNLWLLTTQNSHDIGQYVDIQDSEVENS